MKPELIIKKFLDYKQESRSGYSLRAFARDLEVSPSFLSEVLAGRKKTPPLWIKKIPKLLNLDEISVSELKKAIFQQHIVGTDLELLVDKADLRPISKTNQGKLLSHKKMSVLTKWYFIAVLDFLTLEESTFNEEHIAQRLNLNIAAVREALLLLEREGLIQYIDGKPKKTDKHLRLPTIKSDPAVRNFHIQMLEKAKLELLNKKQDQDFDLRLIFGSTIAANLSKTSEVKQKIQAFVAEIANDFSEGTTNELYQLNLQLFPLTRNG